MIRQQVCTSMRSSLLFSVVICTRSRDAVLIRTVLSIFRQQLLPEEIIIVRTIEKGLEGINVCVVSVKAIKIRVICITISNTTHKMNLAKSTNLGFKLVRNNIVINVDDDVVLGKTVFKNLISVKIAVKDVFAVTGKIIPLGTDVFSTYMATFHNKSENQPKVLPCFGNTTMLIDLGMQRKSNIYFDERVTAGMDTLFYEAQNKVGNVILFVPQIIVLHDFLRGSIINFFRRFWWYGSNIRRLNAINPSTYQEVEVYLYRGTFLIKKCFFLLTHPLKITVAELKDGLSFRFFLPALIKNYCYTLAINLDRSEK